METTNKKNDITMFFATDDAYVPFLAVTLQSLEQNADRNYNYKIKVLNTDNISVENKSKLIAEYSRDVFDIEFVDAIDGRRKYCQCKAGPNTINKDDVTTILGHFRHLHNKARIDKMSVYVDDMIVGVLYGEKDELSAHYKTIDSHYPVYCGADFWKRLTGDDDFYHRLAKAFGEVVEEDDIDGSALIQEKVREIADEIDEKGGL
jgi:hypothetical protein